MERDGMVEHHKSPLVSRVALYLYEDHNSIQKEKRTRNALEKHIPGLRVANRSISM